MRLEGAHGVASNGAGGRDHWLGRVTLGHLPRTGRLSLLGLGLATAASAALLLWAGTDFFFFHDELNWFFEASPEYEPRALLRPSNTHLIAVPRLVHATSLHLFGPEYLPWRVIGVIALVACAGLFFVLARRRIGDLALLPTVVLLFLGSSWDTVISSVGVPFRFAVAAGLGSFLALERGDRRGDVGACLLIAVAVASHSFGLILLVGVAVSVLLAGDRARRAWIFAAPLALYLLWWGLVPRPPTDGATLAEASNLLLSPLYAGVALGSSLAAVTGLNELDPTSVAGFNRVPQLSWILTPVLGLAGAVLLLLRLRRGHLHPSMWVFLATLAAFLASISLSVGPDRPPTATRYIFPGAVIVLLVVAEAARGVRFSPRAVAALVALTALSLAVNLWHLREGARFFTAYGIHAGPTLAMVELAAAEVRPGFRPAREAPQATPTQVRLPARVYLGATARWGSIAPTMEEVRHRPATVRDRADVVLARALSLRLVPASSSAPRPGCQTTRERTGDLAHVALPAGGRMLVENGRRRGATVALRRFGPSFAAGAGRLGPGETALLRVPRDAAPEPWRIAAAPDAVRVCRLPIGEGATQRVG